MNAIKKRFLRKKRRRILWIIFISLFILFPLFFPTVSALAQEGEEEAQNQLNESINELINQLDLDALEDYLKTLEGFSESSVAERLIDYIQGEKFDYAGFGAEILDVLFQNVVKILPAFACIAAIALLSGIISSLRSGSAGRTSLDMIYLVSYASALIPLVGVLIECFQTATESISQMQTQMNLVFPLMLTLMATSGSTATVAVCRPAVGFFSGAIVSVISSVVFPLTITIIAFSMAGNLTSELKISKFSAFFKSINKWIIGVCISVFGIFFTLQGLTAAAHDGIMRRATKYAIGNGIPIVGGFLSGGFDLAIAGSVLIKNSLGNMSIFMLVSILFEPLVLLVSVNLLLRFTAAVTQPFGDSRISDFLGETAGNLQYCTAGLLFTAFLYFLSIVLLVTATEGLF